MLCSLRFSVGGYGGDGGMGWDGMKGMVMGCGKSRSVSTAFPLSGKDALHGL